MTTLFSVRKRRPKAHVRDTSSSSITELTVQHLQEGERERGGREREGRAEGEEGERERETDTEWPREGGERKMVRVEEDGRPDAVSGSAPAEPLSDLV